MDSHALECLDFAAVAELLARHAFSSLGRALAARVRPVTGADLVRRWLRQVAELEQLESLRGLPPFGGVSDVREIVRRCAPPLQVRVEDMAELRHTLAATHAIAAWMSHVPADATEIQELARRIGDFGTIASRISRVIDSRGEVRDDASPKLQRLRAEIQEAREGIGGAVDRLLRDPTIRGYLQFCNHTFHNDRVVLPLRMEYRGRLPGIIHRTSDTGATIYVEPAAVVELNNRVTELRVSEQEEVNRLLWELAHEVHINEAPILKTLDALAVLDLLCAKVRMARAFSLRLPELRPEPMLDVRGARHPMLMELFAQRAEDPAQRLSVVPIDYRLGLDFSMLILTGPNTGGKTVALKTIGLLTQMFQAGLPVPVGPGSVMGIFQNVLIDIGDEQSMQQSLSTFSAHMRRLLEMLAKAGPQTLVLIDELGAGTDPDEGAALGAAVLDELRLRGARVVATTHLGALKSFSLQREGVENACVEFDVETLRPTYVLRIGEPGRSNAIAIAQRLGMPHKLIRAAEANLSRHARQLRAALDETARVKRAAEKARSDAHSANLAAQQAASAAQRERERLMQQQHEYRTWVQRVVHLRAGDAVRVRGFDRDGKVVRMRLEHQRAEVEVGSFSIEVPLAELAPPLTTAPPPREIQAGPQHQPGSGREKRPSRAAEPSGAAASPADGRPAAADPHPRPRTPPSLTHQQILALSHGARVFARRFLRNATVLRVQAEKQVVVLSMGLFEVEVPFSGIGPPAESKSALGRPGARH